MRRRDLPRAAEPLPPTFLACVAAATALSWFGALVAYPHAPSVPDIYNLVYHGSRPARGESVKTFLFGFPAALTVGFALMWSHARGWWSPRRTMSPALGILFAGLWTVIFLVGSVIRSWLVYTHRY